MPEEKITDETIVKKLKISLDSIVGCQGLIEARGQDVVELLLGAANDILHDTCINYYQTGFVGGGAINPPEPACRLGKNSDACYCCELYDNEELNR